MLVFIVLTTRKEGGEMMNVKVYKIPMDYPDDVARLERLLDSGEIRADDIVAIIGKTEGNGLVNDFTRRLATVAFETLLSERLGISKEEVHRRVALIMSGGTEGVLSPHVTVIVREQDTDKEKEGEGKRVAVGVAFTREFLPEEIGTMVQVKETAKAVKEAMKDTGITDPADVHLVLIKNPLLTSERIVDAWNRGKDVVTTDTVKSMGYSRGASALGVALALGEIDESQLSDEVICKNYDLYSTVAATSAGIELMNNQIVLLGNSEESVSDLTIGHSVMKDAIDIDGVLEALRSAGLESRGGCLPSPSERERIVNVFAKAGPHPTGRVRGRRTTMLTDSDISATRHARATVGGLIAGVVGDPMIYVSGGSEHQGPPGGGPVATIVRVKK